MRLCLVALAVTLPGAGLLCAQQHSHLAGIVRDTQEGGVPGASVTVVSEDTGFRRSAVTDSNGGYRVASLQSGHYKVTIRKDGFQTVVRSGIKLDAAQAARIDFELPVGNVETTITVESGAPILQSDDASVGTLVGREWIDRLPLNGRGIQSMLELAPGTVATPATRGEAGQFTANGQRPNSHYFTVDGVSVNTGVSAGGGPAGVTGGVLPGMTAFGSFHNLISTEALEEFRIQTSTAVPEFGRLPGSQVALSSRAGSNNFHGSAFSYLRNHRLDANDWFANRYALPRAASRLYDLGGTLGGPIKRNRAFFFAAYERIDLTQPFTWRMPVPNAAVRQRANARVRTVLEPFPLPNRGPLSADTGEWVGSVTQPSMLNSGSARMDLAVTQKISLFGRYNEAPSRSRFGNWQVNDLDITSRAVTGGSTIRIMPNLIQDFRFNTTWSAADSTWRPDSLNPQPACAFADALAALSRTNNGCGAFYVLSVAGMGQALSGRESATEQRQWNFAGIVTWTRGSHQVRGGGDYRRLTPVRPRLVTYVTLMADGLNDLITAGNTWTSQTQAGESSALLRELSVWAQDTWRVTSRLTLNYGVRWEFNPPPINSRPPLGSGPLPGGIGANGRYPIWELRYKNIAPRISGAYRLTRSGQTILRAGYGVYFDSSLGISTDIVHARPNTVWQIGGPSNDVSGSPRRVIDFFFAPDLRLPVIRQWNIAVERAFTDRSVLSVSYVGSTGRDLLRRELSGREAQNFAGRAVSTNHGSSDYHGLQAQFRKRMSSRTQAHVSYSWSHSIDNGSTDAAMYWIGTAFDPRADRGRSDFDARQSFIAALTYQTPTRHRPGAWDALASNWSLDTIIRARTGFPITLLNSEQAMGVVFANVFRPEQLQGMAVWLPDSNAPGGRRINRAAFRDLGGFRQGSLGRNAINGFGMSQVDLSMRRDFLVKEQRALELRLEAFNLFNQANFGDPVRFLASPLFGESVSMLNLMLGTGTPGSGLTPKFQVGGSRSLQMVLKLRF